MQAASGEQRPQGRARLAQATPYSAIVIESPLDEHRVAGYLERRTSILHIRGSASNEHAFRSLPRADLVVTSANTLRLLLPPVTHGIERLIVLYGVESGTPLLAEIPFVRGLSGAAAVDEDSSDPLDEVLHQVMRGGLVWPMDGVLGALRAVGGRGSSGGIPLTGREQQVLDLVLQGHSNKLIARTIGTSEGTVKAHVSHIMGKLGISNRSELVAFCLSTGEQNVNRSIPA